MLLDAVNNIMVDSVSIAKKLNALLRDPKHEEQINLLALKERLVPELNNMTNYYGDQWKIIAIIDKDLRIKRFDVVCEDTHIVLDEIKIDWLKKTKFYLTHLINSSIIWDYETVSQHK